MPGRISCVKRREQEREIGIIVVRVRVEFTADFV